MSFLFHTYYIIQEQLPGLLTGARYPFRRPESNWLSFVSQLVFALDIMLTDDELDVNITLSTDLGFSCFSLSLSLFISLYLSLSHSFLSFFFFFLFFLFH